MIDVPALLHGAKGFVGVLAPRVLSSAREGALLRLDAGPDLHNHLGGPHAAVLFGLGETAAFAVLLEVFGDLVEASAVPLVKSSEIAYSGHQHGAGARRLPPGRRRGRRAGVVRHPRHGGLPGRGGVRRESDDVETARATYAMVVKRMRRDRVSRSIVAAPPALLRAGAGAGAAAAGWVVARTGAAWSCTAGGAARGTVGGRWPACRQRCSAWSRCRARPLRSCSPRGAPPAWR